MPVSIACNAIGTQAVVSGEFTVSTVEELMDDLFGLLNLPEVSLDLTQLTEFDGCGLQLLVLLLTEASSKQSRIHLSPINPRVQQAMQLLGFDKAVAAPQEPHRGP